jgi:hypothetical protein
VTIAGIHNSIKSMISVFLEKVVRNPFRRSFRYRKDGGVSHPLMVSLSTSPPDPLSASGDLSRAKSNEGETKGGEVYYISQEWGIKKSRILSGGGLGVSPRPKSPPRMGDLGG